MVSGTHYSHRAASVRPIRLVAPLPPPVAVRVISQTAYHTKGTRAHTHRELIRVWLWEPTGSSLKLGPARIYSYAYIHRIFYITYVEQPLWGQPHGLTLNS